MKRLTSIFVAALAVLVVAGIHAPSVSADSAALSIVPKKNYVIEPGDSVDDKLTIRNLDKTSPLKLSLRVVDFTFTDDGGTPKLMLDPNAPQTTWSLKPFLKVPEYVEIPASSSKSLDIKVSIPAGHGAGSYYSAIVYSSTAGEGANVGLSASGVTLAFTQVPGLVKEDLQLKKLGAYYAASQKGGPKYVKFAMEKPRSVAYTLENKGNVTESPVGSITLKHMLGKEQTISNINPTGSLALIGQTRTFAACIKLKDKDVSLNGTQSTSLECVDPGLWPGRYTVTLNAFYGQNGNPTQEIIKTSSFWYLPLWFVLAVVVLALVVTFYIWRLVRKIKGSRPTKVSSPRRRR